ncbi:nucleotide-binding universal stress UspA family protein [Microbacterium halimionae]|uniref:Nucleotide-binding universal stress UspA family protein n=1 Tax=Microbacterium halimionae TaxID=1526413 RepID=A0A7W3PMF0_9MICO|nr:universal stress protein [Microbacterium halimionae]MBA8816854.1 nucleotide-binding universal stress UspA family protein [Microbacterium halimionae]NII94850.1 nucleotide-binding universal stress UspA family protein [Microbacterium halimionae]
MSETIIVGVTEAAASQRALDWAAHRAAADGADLLLSCIVGGAVGAVGEDEVLARAMDAAAVLLDAEITRISALIPGLSISTHVGSGNPTEELIEGSADATLLVIGIEPGARGRAGHHGARIAAGAHCPVVVVPSATVGEQGTRRGVVVGVDGSDVALTALQFAAAEATRLDEPLIAVSAWMPVFVSGDFGMYPDMYTTDLQGITEALVGDMVEKVRESHPDLVVETRIEEGDPATVINAAAESALMTVIGTHGRSGIARFLLGSVSEEVISHLKAPTAVVR